MAFFQEFKEFALKGNALDMAVGIIIGAGFNKIVSSLVNDLVMPPLGMLLGGVDFKNLQFVLKEASRDAAGAEIPAVSIRYGLFVNNVVDFLIVALTIFVVIRAMNRILRLRPDKAPA